MNIRQPIQRIISSCLGIILSFSLIGSTVAAQPLNQDDANSIYNDTVWYKPAGGACGGSVGPLVGSDNVQKAFNFLTGKGLIAAQAAGVIGNLEQESGQGLNPLDQQNGSASKLPIPNVGFGIAQWTDTGRQQGLVNFAQLQGGVPGDLTIQLNYLWQELVSNYPGAYSQLRSDTDSTDPTKAATDFMNGYEGPGTPELQNRINNAKTVLETYSGSTSSNSSGDVSTSACVGAVNCSDASSTLGLSQIRQNVVCIAQQQLALWKSQPGYNSPYPGFAYAQTGLLEYTGGKCSGNSCSGGVYEEWCADFVSWIYQQAAYPFSGGTDGWRISAVASIQALGTQGNSFHWHPGNGYTPKPGDIAIHGSNHTNIFISSTGGQTQYIGGDQGNGPYGQANPPANGATVSTEAGNGYYDNGITGYVSPD
jgi:hypothetical protein